MSKLTLKQRLRQVKGKLMLSVDDDDMHRFKLAFKISIKHSVVTRIVTL